MRRFASRSRLSVKSVLAALGCALSLAAASADAQTVLKFAHVGAPGKNASAFSAGAQAFAETFEKLTGGRYKVEEFGGSALGDESQIIEGMKAGTIDFVLTGLSGPATQIVPELAVIVIPGLFSGPEHEKRVLDGPIGQKILDAMPARGVVGLAMGSNGFRQVLATKKAVRSPADMAGLKFRIPKSAVLDSVFKAWGATPVQMNVDAVYAALGSGQVDGMENALANANSYKFFDHIKYVVMNNYAFSSLVFMMSPDSFADLNDQDKKAVKDAARAGAEATRAFVANEDKRLIAELSAKGVTFITDFDAKAFADAVKPIQDQLGAKHSDIYTQIVAAR